MIDNKSPPNTNDRPEQVRPKVANPERGDEQARESQSSAPSQPAQRTAPGRRPLFRN